MKIFKFGGASVKDAAGVRNVAEILRLYPNEQLGIVVSAMGKTTNALEKLTHAYFYKTEDLTPLLDAVKAFHDEIITELFNTSSHPVFDEVNNAFVEIEWLIEDEPTGGFDFVYDQLVSVGELISSKILSAYLNESGINNCWLDIRDCILTDNNYRDSRIDWNITQQRTRGAISKMEKKSSVFVTQGFMGVTSENYTTTLGREGSDYTAAVLAYCLDAEYVAIWKDVPGVLNADPKWFSKVTKLDKLSYHDAIELSYYGATVIHPKTIQPLQNKGISLWVKSFNDPQAPGTLISKESESDKNVPCYIFKVNQTLISIGARDFSFMVEDQLSAVFDILTRYRVKVNLMQNAAISFSICVDGDESKLPALLQELMEQFNVKYNEGLELLTIRHYNQEIIDELIIGKYIILETRSRNTVQLVMRSNN
jgi:aspartate kinase